MFFLRMYFYQFFFMILAIIETLDELRYLYFYCRKISKKRISSAQAKKKGKQLFMNFFIKFNESEMRIINEFYLNLSILKTWKSWNMAGYWLLIKNFGFFFFFYYYYFHQSIFITNKSIFF